MLVVGNSNKLDENLLLNKGRKKYYLHCVILGLSKCDSEYLFLLYVKVAHIHTYISDDMPLDNKWNRNWVFDKKSDDITIDKKSWYGRHTSI